MQFARIAVQRAIRDLQVRIQEIILKDAFLDQDEPVPPQYQKKVELYYRPDQPIRVTVRAYDEKLEDTSKYRLTARLRDANLRPAAGDPAAPLQEAPLTPENARGPIVAS